MIATRQTATQVTAEQHRRDIRDLVDAAVTMDAVRVHMVANLVRAFTHFERLDARNERARVKRAATRSKKGGTR